MPEIGSVRAVSSTYIEPTEEEVLNGEKFRLKRSLRVLNNDYIVYKEDSTRKIDKQRGIIGSLETERFNLDTNLAGIKSKLSFSKQHFNAYKLQELGVLEKQLIEEIASERRKIAELQEEFLETEAKLLHRQSTTKVKDGTVTAFIMDRKHKSVKNRLAVALGKYNRMLDSNRDRREAIEYMRTDKALFVKLYAKLENKLEKTNVDINNVIKSSSAAFEVKDDSMKKIKALQEANERETTTFLMEESELKRTIEHDHKVKEFMALKEEERGRVVLERKAKAIRANELKKAEAQKETVRVFEDGFNKIKVMTGEEHMDQVIDAYVLKEQSNFSLFKRVGDCHEELGDLQEEIQDLKSNAKISKSENTEADTGRSSLIKNLDKKIEIVKGVTKAAETGLVQINQQLDELKCDLTWVVKAVECDTKPVEQLLIGQEGIINNKNIMIYMGLIENRVNQLTNILLYGQIRYFLRNGIMMEPETNTKLTATFDYDVTSETPAT